MCEVEEWLNIIGLPELYVYFEEDGWVTLDGVTLMTEDDIRAITKKRGHISIILREIERLKFNLIKISDNNQNEQEPVLETELPKRQPVEVNSYKILDEYSYRPSRSQSVPPKQTLDEILMPYIYAKYGFEKTYGPASHGNNIFFPPL